MVSPGEPSILLRGYASLIGGARSNAAIRQSVGCGGGVGWCYPTPRLFVARVIVRNTPFWLGPTEGEGGGGGGGGGGANVWPGEEGIQERGCFGELTMEWH